MLIPAWLWAVFTIIASAAQTARNAMQRDLTATVGTAGATYVRFLFGMPFAALFLLIERVVTGVAIPTPDARAIGWAFVDEGNAHAAGGEGLHGPSYFVCVKS